jgi:putative hydroxymethylpyrimidine transport system ATP-binding protein
VNDAMPAGRACGPAILIEDLSLRFGDGTLFDALCLDIQGGEVTALLGASGIGKTSLLRVIAGLQAADTGRVVAGDGRGLAGRIAYMGQQDLLMPWLPALGNVMLGDRLRGARPDRDRALHLLDRVGLGGSVRLMPGALSGGMRQRVALARTLYEDRPVVLMDEPFSALDAMTRAHVQTLAAELLQGRTVLLITHDPLEACRLAQRVLVMSGFPAVLSDPLLLAGATPRAVDDPAVLSTQGALMRSLLGGAG